MSATTITWSWGAKKDIVFNPATDILDFGWISASYFSISEVNGSVTILIPSTQQSYTLDGVKLSDLHLSNITAKDPSVFAAWSTALAAAVVVPSGGTTTAIAPQTGADTVLAFDPARDKLDFGALSASDFAVAQANGSVMVFLPATQQTYILEGVSLSELSLANISSGSSAVLAKWSAALSGGAGAPAAASASANAAGGVTTAVAWSWGAQTTVHFDPAKDKLDFGWISANAFAVAEVNGSVMILIPATQQTYTLQGVTLSELSLANITGKDASIFPEWSSALAGNAHGGTTTAITVDRNTTTVVDFHPATDTLDFGALSAGDFAIAEANGSVVIYLPADNETYILKGVGLSELTMANIKAESSAVYGEWNTALASAAGTALSAASAAKAIPAEAGDGVTTTLKWAFGTQTRLAFDPATDTLDFGKLSPDDFAIVEVNGSVMILIPSAQQSYTLQGVTLADLTSSDMLSQNGWVLAKWNAALGETGSTGAGKAMDSVAIDAPDWSATGIYTTGDRVAAGNVVYEANWWTRGTDPGTNHGAVGTGHVWTVVGYRDLTPVAPDAPADVHALTTTATNTVLSWDAADVKGVGTLSGYAIYQDGEFIGTTTDRTYKVSGLSPGSTHDFSVVAMDEAGASLHSAPLSVTTQAAGTGGADAQHFSPYMEMWLPTSPDLVQMVDAAGLSSVTLAFVIGTGPGEIGWGAIGTSLDQDTLANGTTISAMVDALHAKGVDVSISFGGAYGQEPALYFDTAGDLTAAYQSVIDKYHVTSLDFDIEGAALTDDAASHLRNEALVALEKANPDLTVSFTLPVVPSGLTQDGLDLIAQAKADGVEIDTVNIMVMNYGAYHATGDMGDDAIAAAEATVAQLEALGIDAKVAITPEAGFNDIPGEVFTLEDAQQLVDYAAGNDHISYLAMWSLGRDNGDTQGYYSIHGSGLSQHDYDFSKIFGTV